MTQGMAEGGTGKKLSVSLPEDDVSCLDEYIEFPRISAIESAYEDANAAGISRLVQCGQPAGHINHITYSCLGE